MKQIILASIILALPIMLLFAVWGTYQNMENEFFNMVTKRHSYNQTIYVKHGVKQ